VSYRAVLAGYALAQFDELKDDPAVYGALMPRLARLLDAPWDAWPVRPGGEEPGLRETRFGEDGLVQFRVDEQAETLIIVNILWLG
jgi:hypothetical protein